MKTKRQEQFGTGFRSVQRLHSWVTAKVLMLLVMLMVSVQGAWAQNTPFIKQNGVSYDFNGSDYVMYVMVTGIDNDVVDLTIPHVVKKDNIDFYVNKIQNNVFQNKTNLRSVIIEEGENGITRIEGGFKGCSNLEQVTLPNSIRNFDNYFFSGCRKLTSVNIPESVTSIPQGLFYNCASLRSFNIPEWITEINRETFAGCTSLRSINIPEGVTSISYEVFKGCTSLENVVMPNTVTFIGEAAFEGCTSLRYIEIPNSVTYLGGELREDSYGLHEYGSGKVFYNCTSLESVKMSTSMAVIPTNTFYGCTSLASFAIPEGVKRIGSYAFWGCPLRSLAIPASLADLNVSGFRSAIPTLTSITIAPGNPTYDSRDNCNAIIETSTNRLYIGCRNTVIPAGVTVMGDAFMNCTGLTTLTLPKSVTLWPSALTGCSNLTTINCKATDPREITLNGNLYTPNVQGVNFKNLKVVVPFPSLELYKNNNNFKTLFYVENIEADPLTEKFNYISDVNFGTETDYHREGYMDYTSPIEITSIHNKLAWNITTSMFNGVTGILYFIVDSESDAGLTGDMKNEYVIDGKTYKRVAANPFHVDVTGEYGQSIRRYITPFITRDGNNLSGAKILSALEVIQSNEPLEDPDFVKGVRIICRTDNRTISDNQDWASEENKGDGHTYIYVKATYKTYQAPLDEVHYTTTDGSKLDISTNAFGSENVFQAENHTYKDGAGVIKFDKAVEGTLPVSIFAGNTKVQNIMLPPGITEIANGAFEGCTALENISFSQEMVSIGTSAFKGCSSLLAVSLPNGLKTLGEAAFEGCSSLARVSVPQYITTLAANTFKGCSNIASVVLPSSITGIGTSAFEDCEKITNVNFKDLKKLASFGSRSFYGCTSLKEVEFWDIKAFTNDVEAYTECEIGTEAFANCTNLKFVSIQKLNRIGTKAFDGSGELFFYAAKYSGNLTTDFADDAFSKNTARTINLHGADQVTAIPAGKFQGYWNLNNFIFPENLTTIGVNAFAGSGMWSLNISHLTKLTDIGEGAFAGCEQLGNIVLPSSLTTIKASTFKGCINMKTLNFNNSVQNIGEEAFANCPDLQTVVFGPALQSIGSKAFAGCKSNMEVVTNLMYEGVYASNLDCFDASVYESGILHKIGDTKENDAIYNNAPWKEFKNKDIGGTYYYVQDGSTYRLYPDNYETLDGRRIKGAVLIDGKSRNYPDVVNEDFPVVAFATGSISGDVGYLGIPGSVIRLEEGFISPSTDIWGIGFDRGSDTLYVEKKLNIPTIHDIRINRDIECLNGGLFENFQTTETAGISLTIDRDATYLSKNCFRNANIKELIFWSNELFGFEQGALAGCKQIRNIRIESNGAGMDESRCSSSTFETDVMRNATVTWNGSDRYKSYQPWLNFVDSEVTQVTVNGATYKIYPRASYSYNIKEDFGVHNITGAVLTGGSFSGDVVIPEKVANFPVIAITKGIFNENNDVTSISFPGTLRMIENNAVEKMENLKKVTFRDQKFPRGEKCYIGYSVYRVIDEEAFYECDKLEEVSIGMDIDWYDGEDEPLEDRDNMKTLRITKGCHVLGKKDYNIINDCDGIQNIILEDSDEPIEIPGILVRDEDLSIYYHGRDVIGNIVNDDTNCKNVTIGPKATEYRLPFKETGTLTFSPNNVLKVIKKSDGFYKDSSKSYGSIVGYCPNLEVIDEYAFHKSNITRSFWFDPEHPEESHLRVIGDAAFNGSSLKDLYLPPTIEKVGDRSGWDFNNVYLYKDPDHVEIGNKFFHYDTTVDDRKTQFDDKPTIHFHILCSRSTPGRYTKSYFDPWDGGPSVNNNIVYVYDIHSQNSKKGGTIQSDGLYHEVCAGCGKEDRSPNTGNYYISNWNGSEDLMVHKKSGFLFYTYPERLTIDDSKPFKSPVEIKVEGGIDYNRTVTGGRVITFVVPFVAYASEVNGTVYKFREFKDNKFCFDKLNWIDELSVNTPYLVVLNEDATQLFRGENTFHENVSPRLYPTLSSTLSPLECSITGSDGIAQHVGSFVQQTFDDGDNGKSYYGYASNDGMFVKAQTATLNPFRTMFTLSQSSNANARIRLQLGGDDTTSIINVDADLLDGDGSPMYDLNGRVITSPVHGQIYIQNGKKISSK